MTISDIMRRDYIRAIEVAESMARRSPPGSKEQNRWHLVAETYRRALSEPAGDLGRARLSNQAPRQVFEG